MDDSYKTIASIAEGTYSEKRSKFLAFALPVETVDEVKRYVAEYQKRYYDARHACYAYMLGAERTEFRANDNGEPSGTAGKPILGQINSYGLTNILIIVVRYFGGIKLGTSGLIVAYRQAAIDAGSRRMVPIFLTTATTAVGVVPMIIAQSAFWMPVGVTIFAGGIGSLILVVTVLPVVYWKVSKK